MESAGDNLLTFAGTEKFGTVLADPPWRFSNRTGKMAPEHRRLSRYSTMDLDEIMEMPVAQCVLPQSHLYLRVPNALVLEGLEVMKRWGSRTRPRWSGTKFGKMGGRMAAVWVSTFAMSRRWCCSACAGVSGRFLLGVAR